MEPQAWEILSAPASTRTINHTVVHSAVFTGFLRGSATRNKNFEKKKSMAFSGYASLGIRCSLVCFIFLFKVTALLVGRYAPHKQSELHTFSSFQLSGALLGHICVFFTFTVFTVLFIDSNLLAWRIERMRGVILLLGFISVCVSIFCYNVCGIWFLTSKGTRFWILPYSMSGFPSVFLVWVSFLSV
jgi:hypothetical protein